MLCWLFTSYIIIIIIQFNMWIWMCVSVWEFEFVHIWMFNYYQTNHRNLYRIQSIRILQIWLCKKSFLFFNEKCVQQHIDFLYTYMYCGYHEMTHEHILYLKPQRFSNDECRMSNANNIAEHKPTIKQWIKRMIEDRYSLQSLYYQWQNSSKFGYTCFGFLCPIQSLLPP